MIPCTAALSYRTLFVLLLAGQLVALADPPAVYYDTAQSKTVAELRVARSATSAPRRTAAGPAVVISELISPAKLATLSKRGANPRVQKCVYWLATARAAKQDPTKTLDTALARAGYINAPAARLTRDALLRNLDTATKLGCLDADGLAEMRHGKAPTIQKGPYQGAQLSVDHIIPRAVCPELDNVIANLELLPLRVNERKTQKSESVRFRLLRSSTLPDCSVGKGFKK